MEPPAELQPLGHCSFQQHHSSDWIPEPNRVIPDTSKKNNSVANINRELGEIQGFDVIWDAKNEGVLMLEAHSIRLEPSNAKNTEQTFSSCLLWFAIFQLTFCHQQTSDLPTRLAAPTEDDGGASSWCGTASEWGRSFLRILESMHWWTQGGSAVAQNIPRTELPSREELCPQRSVLTKTQHWTRLQFSIIYSPCSTAGWRDNHTKVGPASSSSQQKAVKSKLSPSKHATQLAIFQFFTDNKY